MLKRIICILLLCTLSVQSFAAVVNQAVPLNQVFQKYDYLLTAHPSAHETEFRNNTIADFKDEIELSLSGKTQAEKIKAFEQVVEQLPTQDLKVAYIKLIKNSSEEELAKLATNDELLKQSLQGQGANFYTSGINWETVGYIALGAALVGLLVWAAIVSAKYQYYTASDDWSCGHLSAAEEQQLVDLAMTKCKTRANHPETCRLSGVSSVDRSDVDDEYADYDCVATVIATRKLK